MRRAVLVSVAAHGPVGRPPAPTPVRGQTARPSRATRRMASDADERRGMVFDGLRRRPGGPCGDGFEIVEPGHRPGASAAPMGPTPPPTASTCGCTGSSGPRRRGAPRTARRPPRPRPGIPCFGTGSDGYRVQLLYVRRRGRPTSRPPCSPTSSTWRGQRQHHVPGQRGQDGRGPPHPLRHRRRLQPGDQQGEVSLGRHRQLLHVHLTSSRNKGFTRSDRKYLAWVDANTYCGIGEIYLDDQPDDHARAVRRATTTTASRASRAPSPGSTTGAGAQSASVEAHELTHTLGGVQTTAPNATTGFHCRDESDRMCYSDASRREHGAALPGRPRAAARLQQRRLLQHQPGGRLVAGQPTGTWPTAPSWRPSIPGGHTPPPHRRRPPDHDRRATRRPPRRRRRRRHDHHHPPPPATTTTAAHHDDHAADHGSDHHGGPAAAPRRPPGALAAYRLGRARRGCSGRRPPPARSPGTTSTGSRGRGRSPRWPTSGPDHRLHRHQRGRPAVTYTYTVSAENGAREGPLSNEVTAIAGDASVASGGGRPGRAPAAAGPGRSPG